MNYRNLGRTGLKVSEICLGNWMTHGHQLDVSEAIKVVHAAFDLGINFFDTADMYAEGAAEEILGKTIRGIPRQEIVIATKCYWPVHAKGLTAMGHSRKHIFEAVDASLKRLKLDYVDLYQLHKYDETTPLEETLGALNDLIRHGKTLYVGCSNYHPKLMQKAYVLCKQHQWAWFTSNQPRYNLLKRETEQGLMQICKRQGVGLMVYSPLAQGFLTGKYHSEKDARGGTRLGESEDLRKRYFTRQNFMRVSKLCEIAKEWGCTPGQLALRWVLRKKEVSSAIVGARSVEQIRENTTAVDVEVSPNVLEKLSRIFPIN